MIMASETITFDPDGDLVLILTAFEEQHIISAETNSLTVLATGSTNSPKEKPSKELRMLVSSKIMTLVSPVFKAMLRHQTFKEGYDLANGQAEIPLPEDDAFATQILLNIFHYRVNMVPRKVDINTATNIAILVDKYRLHPTVLFYSELWIKELKGSSPLPRALTATLLPWLCISWVFDLADEFKHLTWIAQGASAGSLQNASFAQKDLPIPTRVFEAIEDDRQKSIEEALRVISSTIAKYEGPETHCTTTTFRFYPGENSDIGRKNRACDGTIFGSLLKSTSMQKLWPLPRPPYSGLAWWTVISKAKSLEVTSLCDHADFSQADSYDSEYSTINIRPQRPSSSHGVKNQIVASISAIREDMTGLSLADFKPNMGVNSIGLGY